MLVTGFQILGKKTLNIDTEITKADVAKVAALVAAGTLAAPGELLAAEDISEKIAKAADPIKQLLIGVADPVCYLVFVWGLLECMLGKGSSGISRMKFAALGYAGLNWLPVLMQILRSAKP